MSKPTRIIRTPNQVMLAKKILSREKSHAMENLWWKKKMGEKRTENESLELQPKKMKRGTESEEDMLNGKEEVIILRRNIGGKAKDFHRIEMKIDEARDDSKEMINIGKQMTKCRTRFCELAKKTIFAFITFLENRSTCQFVHAKRRINLYSFSVFH
jgi:hypothetical protein